MGMIVSRRAFLKGTALAAGAVAGGGVLLGKPALLEAGRPAAPAAGGGGDFYQFVNATKGAFTDEQISWAWEDRGPYTPLSKAKTAPNGPGGKGNGRLYIQMTDGKTKWTDFVEWAGGGTRWAGNTTQVDEFVIPMTIEMGKHKIGISESRKALFAAFTKDAPKEFKACVKGDRAIVSPFKADLGEGKPYANYFEKYVDEVWAKTPLGDTKPTTRDILLGIGGAKNPGVCSAFNRHVAENKADWRTPAKFYLQEPCNWYSKFLHEHTVDKHCYGFCYDDYAEQAAYFGDNGDKLTLTIYWD
jgi:hypothetical protein